MVPDLSAIRIDPVLEHEEWLNSDADGQKEVLSLAKDRRVGWASHFRNQPKDQVSPRIHYPDHLKNVWDTVVGDDIQYGTVDTAEKVSKFNLGHDWLYYLLGKECSHKVMERVGVLRDVAAAAGEKANSLVYGAGIGTYCYALAEANHTIAAVELAGSGSLKALRARNNQNYLNLSIMPVSSYGSLPDYLAPKYSVVVILDILDRIDDPVSLVRVLAKKARLLVVSFKFKKGLMRPWVREKISGVEEDPSEHLRKILTSRSECRMSLIDGSNWEDDIVILSR